MVGIRLLGNKYTLPTQASEVNTLTFLKLQEAVDTYEEFDQFDLLEILTEIDRQALISLEDERMIDTMLEATAFIFEMMAELKASKGTTFKRLTGEEYNLPKDYANTNFGQRIALNSLSAKYEKDKDETAFVIGAIAILVAPTVYAESDWTKHLEELEDEIKLMPCVDALPIFNFFLSSTFSLKRIIKSWLHSRLTLRRFRQR
jgi:hypothetical protein